MEKQIDWCLISVEPNQVIFGYHGYRLIVHQYPRKWYSLHKGDRLIVSSRKATRIALSIAIRRLPQPAPILANLPPLIVKLANFFNFLKNCIIGGEKNAWCGGEWNGKYIRI